MHRLTPKAEEWLFRLLLAGEEGIIYAEFRMIDQAPDCGDEYQELSNAGFVQYFSREPVGDSAWKILPAGIEYLEYFHTKGNNHEPSN